MPLIELRKVSKSYAEPERGAAVPVLRGIDLSIEAGESLAIVGPSGCGKSTLLNLLGTLDEADEGEVFFEGESLRGASAQRLSELRSRHIGFIFQLHHLLPQLTVLENVLVPTLALKGKAKSPQSATQAEARARDLLAAVGLAERVNYKPAQLSGGERQRVAVVRALINEPRLILADEPTGALDEANAAALTELLITLQKQTGVSLVLVTHHREQAARMGRVLVMHEGRIQ
jgi:ABC-type lipoprotein export system ATPase subunit